MAAPRKSGVADKAGSTEATKASPPPAQRASAVAKKTSTNKVAKKDGENNPEAATDGADATKKVGARYRSQSHPYANSFRKVMAD